MKAVSDFVLNALPWVAMGLAIAFYGTYQDKKQKEKNNNK